MTYRDRLFQGLRQILGSSEGVTVSRSSKPADADAPIPERLGRFRVVSKLGQGGMGVVYAAHDDELDRPLAVKVVAQDLADETAMRRFRREARAAAAVNHPNVCQLYEIGEEGGALFIAMELLVGEPLSDRLKRGALPLAEGVPLIASVLSALSALHGRGLVHRDLKPSNIFLTPYGVKLLDFGLARPGRAPEALTRAWDDASALTTPGMIVGTPGYMAPEQVRGEDVDPRADIFATGALLFEILSGRPPFAGASMVEVLYRTLHENPPALSGSPAVAAVDRVLRKALQKKPEDRPPSAEAFRLELAAVPLTGAGSTAEARALTRLVVLPFRMLRPDPDTDFLSLGLADGVSASLSNLRTLVVRSSAAASRFATGEPDLKRIAAEADVDLVLLGTVLRSGDRLRVASQLVEAPSGTLLGAHSLEAPVGDLFELQDQLSRRIVESLALPLQGGGRSQPPASPRAYELYLRANHVSREYDRMPEARDLYLQAIEEDSGFAPAWAMLGRAYRLIGKFIQEPEANAARAEHAFRRALELDPELSLAHKLYAHLEAESGRAPDAMARLLSIAKSGRPDAELFAGLVHACRYSGLFDASLAAHEEARRLDPHVKTSLAYTLYLRGDYGRLAGAVDGVIDLIPKVLGLAAQGLRKEALAVFTEELEKAPAPRVFDLVRSGLGRVLSGGSRDTAIVEEALAAHTDPEALYLIAILFGELGDLERGLDALERAVRGGYLVSFALESDPLLAPLRAHPRFAAIADLAEKGCRDALLRFESAEGRTLLGI